MFYYIFIFVRGNVGWFMYFLCYYLLLIYVYNLYIIVNIFFFYMCNNLLFYFFFCWFLWKVYNLWLLILILGNKDINKCCLNNINEYIILMFIKKILFRKVLVKIFIFLIIFKRFILNWDRNLKFMLNCELVFGIKKKN